jgi:nicotinamide-nucleotide amidase
MRIFPSDVMTLAEELLERCKAKDIMFATAESCTGGLIAACMTEIAGSSSVVDRGFITYSNEAKQDMLGVKSETLAQFGAVSAETALEMVSGALKNSRASLAVAVTGVAGPGGGTPAKPIGLVHIAVQFRDKTYHNKNMFGALTRAEIRLATVREALQMCIRAVS